LVGEITHSELRKTRKIACFWLRRTLEEKYFYVRSRNVIENKQNSDKMFDDIAVFLPELHRFCKNQGQSRPLSHKNRASFGRKRGIIRQV
jgi:hypothetical protein